MLETEVRKQLGYSKPTMRQVREQLQEGVHWSREGAKGMIAYSARGLQALEELTGMRFEPGDGRQEIEEGEATVTPEFRRWGNERLISASLEGGGAIYVHIRPEDRELYVPRMRIKVRRMAEMSAAHWRVVGRPRTRGRM